ncbi:MAG TPA: acetyl-CoA carboxylase biotin carboxyl carrier protein subunit [Chloroflexota bacterium]|nr:acetyl-CoA carboxylase biotin carboxyl carrier protein subunit [Chloroflexota bacterium]
MSVRRLRPGLYSVLADGRSYEVALDGEVAYVDGAAVPIEIEDRLALALASVAGGAGTAGHGTVTVAAPMPGRIVAVPVTPGTQVERGQSIVVLEAMKMESTIAAPAAGVVSEVLVQPGQAVTQRQALVRIDPPTS